MSALTFDRALSRDSRGTCERLSAMLLVVERSVREAGTVQSLSVSRSVYMASAIGRIHGGIHRMGPELVCLSYSCADFSGVECKR